MTEIAVRPFEDRDLGEVVGLVNLAMGSSARRFTFDEAYWRWKHFDNPSGRSPCLVAVTPGGRIVGVRAFMRWTWQRGEALVRAVRAVDTAVHPEFQGHGLFTRLTKQLLQQVAAEGEHFVFNTPNSKSLPGYVKMGWRELGRGTLWLKPLRPLRIARAALRSRGAPGSNGGWDVEGLPAEHLLSNQERDERAGASAELTTRRTAEYLRWRYVCNPTANYRVWLDSGRRSPAAVVRGGVRGGLHEILLCDVFPGRSLTSVATAAGGIRRMCRQSQAHYAAACAAGDSRIAATLVAAGFLPLPRRGPVLTVRDLGGLSAPRSIDQLCTSIGDLELF